VNTGRGPHSRASSAAPPTSFFVTLRPLKVLGPFAQRTRDMDADTTRQVAVRAFAAATIAVVMGGLLGRVLLDRWHLSMGALTLAGGTIFFLVALKQLMAQYESPPAATAEAQPAPPTAAALPTAAAFRLVFPIVLTPYGIAVVIALLAASDRAERTEGIGYGYEPTDVGRDALSPVTNDYARGDNTFTGTIQWVELEGGEDSHDHLINPEDFLRVAMAKQ
jgi:small neutral amino acid transporter SnatA (MarC family)